MGEKIKNQELENILIEVMNNISNNPKINELISIINGGGGRMEQLREESLVVTVYDNDKYAEFHGKYRKRKFAERDLWPLLDYLNKNGYEYKLD